MRTKSVLKNIFYIEFEILASTFFYNYCCNFIRFCSVFQNQFVTQNLVHKFLKQHIFDEKVFM